MVAIIASSSQVFHEFSAIVNGLVNPTLRRYIDVDEQQERLIF